MNSHQEFFNEIAYSWDNRFCNEKLFTFLEEAVPKFGLSKGNRVLDVGTGTGVLIPFLLDSVGPSGHITAIDFAEKMIEICKAKYANYPNVNCALQSIERLDFPAESFDIVTCFGLFPHIENKKEALDRINQVLKPSGRLIIAHALSSSEISAHHHNTSPIVAHDVLPDSQNMRRLLKQSGFINILVQDRTGSYVCKSEKSIGRT
jgi:demethylmenaquinone methyltransferase/2-methoxy-6-polyprenyl-1,4-benzoquinol methylase